jgi:hypothetical protein
MAVPPPSTRARTLGTPSSGVKPPARARRTPGPGPPWRASWQTRPPCWARGTRSVRRRARAGARARRRDPPASPLAGTPPCRRPPRCSHTAQPPASPLQEANRTQLAQVRCLFIYTRPFCFISVNWYSIFLVGLLCKTTDLQLTCHFGAISWPPGVNWLANIISVQLVHARWKYNKTLAIVSLIFILVGIFW